VLIGAEFNAQLFPRVVTEMPRPEPEAAKVRAR
jgi:hypothetical protein